eukprot:3116068-Pyramimonas_sp.AAC.1
MGPRPPCSCRREGRSRGRHMVLGFCPIRKWCARCLPPWRGRGLRPPGPPQWGSGRGRCRRQDVPVRWPA